MTHFTPQPTQMLGFDLVHLNRRFDRAYPKEILAWCGLNIPTGLVQASDFNLENLVISDLLYRQIKPIEPVPVIFVDTLHHFRETLTFVKQAEAFYGLDLRVYTIKGINSRQAFTAKYGDSLWQTDLEKFYELTKIEPLQRAIEELNPVAWITGRQRDHSPMHAHMPIFEWDKQGRLKINPLANWSRTESWAYVYEYDMIYNPLYDQGYSDIGDEPLTFTTSEQKTEPIKQRLENEETEVLIHAYL